jgi:hypothetical protein
MPKGIGGIVGWGAIGALLLAGLPGLLDWSREKPAATPSSVQTNQIYPAPSTRTLSAFEVEERAKIWKQYYDVLAVPAWDAALFGHKLTVGWEYEIETDRENFIELLQHFADMVAFSLDEMVDIKNQTDVYDDIGKEVNDTARVLTYSSAVYQFKEAIRKLPDHPTRQTISLISREQNDFNQSITNYFKWIDDTKKLIKLRMQQERAVIAN